MKTIGDRITYCRSSIGLTRKELVELWGEISIPTLSRWELNIIEPTAKKISSIAEFFCSKGIIVSAEWIKNGRGLPPSLLNMKEFLEDDFDDICEQSFLDINQKVKGFTYYKVTSNFFAPIIRYGDYVGGVKIDSKISKNDNFLAFVVCANTVHVGLLESNNTILLKNTQGKVMEFSNYSFLGKVHWTAVRP